MMIRVVLLTDCLVDPNAGGAERKIYELAQRLDKNLFRVTLASMECEATSATDIIQKFGCTLETFKVKRIYGLSGLLQGLRFRRFLKREKIDILMTYHFGSDIWGTFWAHLAGVKTIISNRRDMGFWRNERHIKAYRFINKWVTRIFVVANAVKRIVMEEEGVAEGKIEVMYNGVDLEKFKIAPDRNIRSSLGINESDIVIMHVANFKKVKGHTFLLTAFAGLFKSYPNTKLVLIGEDEFNGELQRMAQELGIGNAVLFLGKRGDVPQLLKTADICVLPSLSEGMSNAILEYMVCAKPVVATAVGGNPETVEDGVTGILVPPKDSASLQTALEKLIVNKNLREAMGQAGEERIRKIFELNKMIEKYQTTFMKLAEEA